MFKETVEWFVAGLAIGLMMGFGVGYYTKNIQPNYVEVQNDAN